MMLHLLYVSCDMQLCEYVKKELNKYVKMVHIFRLADTSC